MAQWLVLGTLAAGTRALSPFGELRSHKLHNTAKKTDFPRQCVVSYVLNDDGDTDRGNCRAAVKANNVLFRFSLLLLLLPMIARYMRS